MAIKRRHVKAIIQLRRATEKEWEDYDPILRLAEPALSTDVYKLKIGDGKKHWSEIPYLLQNEMDYIIDLINHGVYTAGNGIQIINREISLDSLIIDCGTSTTNVEV